MPNLVKTIPQEGITNIRKIFEQKYADPLTRQEFFGEMTTAEHHDFGHLMSLPSTKLFVFEDVDQTVKIYVLEKADAIWSVTRHMAEFPEVEQTHVVAAISVTSTTCDCPLTTKRKRMHWTSYITPELLEEIKKYF